jgi:hypothetical protein
LQENFECCVTREASSEARHKICTARAKRGIRFVQLEQRGRDFKFLYCVLKMLALEPEVWYSSFEAGLKALSKGEIFREEDAGVSRLYDVLRKLVNA